MSNVKAIIKQAEAHGAMVLDLKNDGDEPVAVDLEVAAIPSLSLEVEDAAGKPVLMPPPPVPRADRSDAWVTLAPGDSREVEIAWTPPAWWASGDYRVRYRYRGRRDEKTPAGVRRAGEILGEQRTVKHVRPEDAPPDPPKRRKGLFGRPKPCKYVGSREVDVTMTQTITEATDPAWNGTYAWHARFQVTVDQPNSSANVVVRVRVTGTSTEEQRLAWEAAIQQKWAGFKICSSGGQHGGCCTGGYAINIDLRFVSSGEHFVVTAGSSTTSMTSWGATDIVDVTHEFGHMLGNKDEYYTVDGIAYGTPRQATGNIMNNPANLPIAGHFTLICQQVQALLQSSTCTPLAAGQACA